MTGGPVPRLTPYQVLQVLDQMRAEAEQAEQMVVWRHSTCGGFNRGIWDEYAHCRVCSFEVKYREHVDQYLLIPVPEEAPKPPEPSCKRCLDRKIVPDFTNWDSYHGEPNPKPCPECTPQTG